MHELTEIPLPTVSAGAWNNVVVAAWAIGDAVKALDAFAADLADLGNRVRRNPVHGLVAYQFDVPAPFYLSTLDSAIRTMPFGAAAANAVRVSIEGQLRPSDASIDYAMQLAREARPGQFVLSTTLASMLEITEPSLYRSLIPQRLPTLSSQPRRVFAFGPPGDATSTTPQGMNLSPAMTDFFVTRIAARLTRLWPRINYRKLRAAVGANGTLESFSVAVIELAPPDVLQTVMAIVCDELCWARQMLDECVPPQPRPADFLPTVRRDLPPG
jgi:hypothetical protein